MFNKELEAGMLALNIRIDNMQRDISTILKGMTDLRVKVYASEVAVNELTFKIDKLTELSQEEKPTEPEPFKTKEGLFNYKHRKPLPKEE